MKRKRKRTSRIPVGAPTLTKDDFKSDQDVRWCPSCGDYSILAQTHGRYLNSAFRKRISSLSPVSAVQVGSRTIWTPTVSTQSTVEPPTIASGVKMANPDLSVWVITGDGDALSIGGNHFIHLMRRNFDINVLLFNNRVYGLTKGQYSPTSERGQKMYQSAPLGSLDTPFNPISLALASGATFVARSVDIHTDHLRPMLKAAFEHKGTSFIEIYQNCHIFNDDTFELQREKEYKTDHTVLLEHGEPLVFGAEHDKGIRLNGFQPEVVDLTDGEHTIDDLIVHDQYAENPP